MVIFLIVLVCTFSSLRTETYEQRTEETYEQRSHLTNYVRTRLYWWYYRLNANRDVIGRDKSPSDDVCDSEWTVWFSTHDVVD